MEGLRVTARAVYRFLAPEHSRILAVLLSLGLLLSPVGISSGHADVASGHGWTANDGHDRFEAEPWP